MSYLSFSKRWAGFLAASTGLASEKEVILTYAIEVLVINLVNVLLTLTLGMFLGVLTGTVACLTAVALLRHTAGGAHSSSPWRCAMITVSIFPAMALTASFISRYGQRYIDILAAVVVLAGMVTMVRLAPVDSPAAPIVSPARRKRLKVMSVFVVALIAVAIIVLRQVTWVHALEIQVCLILSILWESFILSFPGHRTISFLDGILQKKMEGVKR